MLPDCRFPDAIVPDSRRERTFMTLGMVTQPFWRQHYVHLVRASRIFAVATCLILAPLCFLGFGFFGPRGCLRSFGSDTDLARRTNTSANAKAVRSWNTAHSSSGMAIIIPRWVIRISSAA